MNARIPAIGLLSVLALLPPSVHGQDDGELTDRTELLSVGVEGGILDPPPDEHLGWGTLEDVFVDLGAGAAVSTISGNLVVYVEPISRLSLPAGARMALTYSHLDPEGATNLGPGWSFDLGRYTASGPWGDRLLVDGDGFRDSFWAGPPPSGAELDSVADDVVAAWRRDTSAAQRRALGGVRALRELLTNDPATLGAMRLRYLGAPEDESELVFRSGARGVRTLQDAEGGRLLTLADGSEELYGDDGQLSEMRPANGPSWTMRYADGRLVAAVSRGVEEWALLRDSWGRIQTLRTPVGETAALDYVGPLLRGIDSPNGSWSFDHDERGRLTSMSSGLGRVSVRYGTDGRVESASGPLASVELRAAGDVDSTTVSVTGLPGGIATVRWEDRPRRRTMSRGGALLEAVTFGAQAALPTSIETAEGEVTVRWSDAGRLLAVAGGGREVTWERDAAGTVRGVKANGQQGAVQTEGGRLLSWSDPGARRTVLETDQDGRTSGVSLPGGSELAVQWGPQGGVATIAMRDGILLAMPRPGSARGALEWGRAIAGVHRDAGGRLTRFEGPTGRTLTLSTSHSGRIDSLGSDLAAIQLTYDGSGLLTGWSGPEGALVLQRDPIGRPQALVAGEAARWAVGWDGAGRPHRLSRDGTALAVTYAEGGLSSWERPGGGRTTLGRDAAGRITRIADTAGAVVELELDTAGDAVFARRAIGGWRIQRDRTGRMQGMTDPLGKRTDLTLDGAGRAESVSAPAGQSWRLRRDTLGRLTTVISPEGEWNVRRGPSGLPSEFSTPLGRRATQRHDRVGRPIELELPGGALVRATWGLGGPTQLGAIRWRFGPSGSLVGWGDESESELRWFVDQDVWGRARALRRRGADLLEIAREDGVRPTHVGPWRLDWRSDGLHRLSHEAPLGQALVWTIGRDTAGRASSFVDPWTRSIEIERDLNGDVGSVSLEGADGAGSAAVSRDQSGRVERLELGGLFGPGALGIERDGLGRAIALVRERRGAIALSASIQWTDVPPPEKGPLAGALGVETEEAPPRLSSGSRALTLTSGLGRELFRQTTVRDADGRPAPVRHSSSPPARTVTWWGPTPVLWDTGPVLPSIVGSGPLLTGQSLRLGGRAPVWGSGSAVRLETRGDPVGTARPEHPLRPGAPAPDLVGDAARLHRIWTGGSPAPADLAWMPEAVPEAVRAWAHANDRFAAEALVPADVGRGGAGALLPALPLARTLVPGPSNAHRLGLMELLVLAGDLPANVVHVSDLAGLGPAAWQVEVPGAAALASVRRRLDTFGSPPGRGEDRIAEVAPWASGVLTERGARLEQGRRWDVRPALNALPAGAPALLPGAGAPGDAEGEAIGSTSRAGRGTAFDALADDPMGVGEIALGRADGASTLLALRALARVGGTGLGGLLPDPAGAESWLIELPSGERMVIDGRGRLLSIDVGGRLQRAFTEATTALLARALLTGLVPESGRGSLSDPSDDSPWLPPFLPQRGGVVESRWGLAPGTPDVPLDAQGRVTAPGWPRLR
jgi:YD repeat-containing protein